MNSGAFHFPFRSPIVSFAHGCASDPRFTPSSFPIFSPTRDFPAIFTRRLWTRTPTVQLHTQSEFGQQDDQLSVFESFTPTRDQVWKTTTAVVLTTSLRVDTYSFDHVVSHYGYGLTCLMHATYETRRDTIEWRQPATIKFGTRSGVVTGGSKGTGHPPPRAKKTNSNRIINVYNVAKLHFIYIYVNTL